MACAPKRFRKRREAADVRKQDGRFAQLAAEIFIRCGQPVPRDAGRHRLVQQRAHPPLLRDVLDQNERAARFARQAARADGAPDRDPASVGRGEVGFRGLTVLAAADHVPYLVAERRVEVAADAADRRAADRDVASLQDMSGGGVRAQQPACVIEQQHGGLEPGEQVVDESCLRGAIGLGGL